MYTNTVENIAVAVGIDRFLITLYARYLVKEIPVEVADTRATFKISGYPEFIRFQSLMDERHVAEHLIEQLSKDDVFYDIGANVGLYTCLVANMLPPEQILAAEPHPENVRRLRENLQHNNSSATICEAAIGAESGVAELELHGNQAGEGKHALAGADAEETIRIDVVTADELSELITPPTVIKIDVEGAEALVLQGLEPLLADCRPVYCEIHPEDIQRYDSAINEIYELMESYGFQAHQLMERDEQPFILFKR